DRHRERRARGIARERADLVKRITGQLARIEAEQRAIAIDDVDQLDVVGSAGIDARTGLATASARRQLATGRAVLADHDVVAVARVLARLARRPRSRRLVLWRGRVRAVLLSRRLASTRDDEYQQRCFHGR